MRTAESGSPDASQLVLTSVRNGKWDLFVKPASGATDERPLLVNAQKQGGYGLVVGWAVPALRIADPKTGVDLWAMLLAGDQPVPVTNTSFDERQGQFSMTAGGWRMSPTTREETKCGSERFRDQAAGSRSRPLAGWIHAGDEMTASSFMLRRMES